MKISPALRPGRIQQALINIRSSFWFIPSLLVFSFIALALTLTELDRWFNPGLSYWWPSFFITEPDGARGMLSAIATSMATVAGVVFSITIVALALASSQYTSRVLRNFMRDRVTQLVLGVFIGVHIYALLVLRTITSNGSPFVPSLAVLAALVLAIVASGFFIYFIHHISSSIQAVEIARVIGIETLWAIDRMFPEKTGHTDTDSVTSEQAQVSGPWITVPSMATGYIQAMQMEALRDFAATRQTTVRMEARIGDFIAWGGVRDFV